VNVDNLSIFYVFCCLHKIRFFTDINKYYYIIYVLLSCDSSISQNYDISVIHPPIQFSNFRPTYLIFDDTKSFELPKSIQKKKYLNYLIKVFKEEEPNSAVPIDQFELYSLDMRIIVPKGNYRIEVCNSLNEVIKIVNIIF
jgi:hypothetical protein